jgi:surface antigen
MIVNKLFAVITREIKFFHHLAWAVAVSFLLLSVPQNALALTKPTLQSPANNSQITTPSVTFSWSHPYNDQYEVKIKTSGGTLKYASGKTSSKSKTVNLSSIPLTYGSTYIWYVVVYASGQEISSTDSSFTYKFAGRVDLSGGVNVSPSSVTIGQNFTVSFSLKEFQGGPKTFEYVQLWIQNSSGGDLYTAQQWSNVAFAANQQRTFSATANLNPAQGRSAGTYRAIVRGQVAGEAPFNFGVVSGIGAVTPKTFTAVATASPTPPSPSQTQPVKPAASALGDQQIPVVSGQNPFKNFVGQCTWWVCEKLIEHNWTKFPSIRHAKFWLNDAKDKGFVTGTTPVTGTIVVFIKNNEDQNKKGTDLLYNYGHVAYVENVNGNIYKISESNYDGNQKQREIWSNDKNFYFNKYLAGFIYPPQLNKSNLGNKYSIRISNIDDEGTCYVNGHKVGSVGYYNDTGWIDITNKLIKGKNEIEFKVVNRKGGFTYYFGFKENEKIEWEKKCGKVGEKGCSEKLNKNDTLTKKFSFNL